MNGEFEKKYKAIIKYIAHEYHAIGKTQLYKILFFLDRESYKVHKETFTGDTYIKGQYGPTPKKIPRMLDELVRAGSIIFVNKRIFSYEKQVLTLLENYSEALSNEFNEYIRASDVSHIKAIVAKYKSYTSRDFMTETHNSIYHALAMHAEIPNFILEFYEDEPVSAEKLRELKQKYVSG